ncbi:MAG TPA: MFS transporter [Baekduia sp.]|nr:MFS transporter [Baekduia sp.]
MSSTETDDARASDHDGGDAQDPGGPDRTISGGEWRKLALLGVPSLALALATTVVTTYLPVHLQAGKASPTMIGLLIGTEGLMAMIVPLIAGTWSDRLRTPLGGRLPFLIAALPPLVLALVLLGLVSGLGLAAALLFLFFAAYFTAYEPYRALYPDLVDDDIAGRAQSSQAIARGLGTFFALVGGGLLIALADPAPFIAAAVVSGGGLVAFVVVVARRGADQQDTPPEGGVRAAAEHLVGMLRQRRELRLYLYANALWELALGALKTFVVLYLTIGLGYALSTSSLIIGGVAVFLLAASPISGKLGDRYGRMVVLQWSLVVYGLGLLVPLLITQKAIVAVAVPFIALGGGVVMTLPYAVLIPLMEDEEHGALTGFYSLSRGVGTALGPLLAGAAIGVSDGLFPATKGYQATWGVCAAALLLSILPLRALRRAVGDEAERDGSS